MVTEVARDRVRPDPRARQPNDGLVSCRGRRRHRGHPHRRAPLLHRDPAHPRWVTVVQGSAGSFLRSAHDVEKRNNLDNLPPMSGGTSATGGYDLVVQVSEAFLRRVLVAMHGAGSGAPYRHAARWTAVWLGSASDPTNRPWR